jgi:DNA modification methylase/ParB-like chromosome segregation protein Spo0J
MSENAEVIQGRLGWESGDVSEAKVANLEPHPKNDELYGDTTELPSTFVESVREKGVLEPLVITTDKQVISGHRRLSAAKKVGVESVPVRISEFETELAEREALIEFNRQREKTPGQVVNEFEEMLEIEKERAKERQEELGRNQGKAPSGNVSQRGDEGRARDKAADKIDASVSGRTLEKGLEVKEKAKEGDETAQKEWEKLEQGETSFHKANRNVKKENNKKEREEKREEQKEKVSQEFFGEDAVDPQLYVSQAGELPFSDSTFDLIITSPPYNLGHKNWKMGGEGREPRESGIGYEDDRNEMEYQAWQLEVFNELHRVASDGASFFYNHKPRQVDGEVIHPMDWIRDESNPWTLRQEIVWDRESTHNHSPHIFWPIDERIYWMVKGDPKVPESGTGMHSIWEFHGPKPDTDHPAPFPDELPRRCIEAVASDGDVVLDPFGGSMTTCEVAAKLGYESHGIDVDRCYVSQKREEWGIDDD